MNKTSTFDELYRETSHGWKLVIVDLGGMPL